MNDQQPDLNRLWNSAWSLLLRGKNDARHPYHLAVTATVSPTLHPRPRTLVLRNALKSEAQLWCYTDRRSGKAGDLASPPGRMAWTFWSPRARIQVNASGLTTWLNDERTMEIFNSLPKHSRKAYATTLPPGTPVDSYTDGLPQDWAELSLEQTGYAAANFGVLVTTLQTVDILELHREGHRRMRATRPFVDKSWNFTWVIP